MIKWSEMHSWQKNQLVSEKIFGVVDFFCIGKLIYAGNNFMYRHNYYKCDDCNVTITFAYHPLDHPDRQSLPPEHNKPTPHYSESMDAAWKIINKMISSEQETFGRFCGELLDMGWASVNSENIYPASEAIRMMAKLTPEKICLAALKACGVEVKS